MPIRDWPEQERPREKLLAHGAHKLSDAELLAIFLRTGIPGKTAVDLGRELLTQFGTLRHIITAEAKTFCHTPGLGIAKYAQLQAAVEIAQRCLAETLRHNDAFENIQATHSFLTANLRNHEHEVFACMFLDNVHRLLAFDKLFHGTINTATIHTREVVKRALQHNAAAVIFAHNHPSGIADPSTADLQITEQLKDALELIDVRVLDHIIIGEGQVVSFAKKGLL